MTVSRKSPGEEAENSSTMITKNHIYELTPECAFESKEELQKRSGYDEVSEEVLMQKAVDEKLPMGSQSY